MRILVYGAGVLGCELAHVLSSSIHDVFLLARGDWKKTIDAQGLVIRHYIQMKTTVDQIKTVDELKEDDYYDLIFVVMQCCHLPSLLPILGRNCSRRIIFVGNNGDAMQTETLLQSYSTYPKEIAFGFQGTGGRKESHRVVSIYMHLSMTIGGSHQPLSLEFQKKLLHAFEHTRYQLNFEHQMDAWLKCHLAFILPICYLCYGVNGHLPQATHKQRKDVLNACYEGYSVLKALSIPIRPENDDLYFYKGRKRKVMELMWFVMAKTPIGRLAASEHAMKAIKEMKGLDAQFDLLCQKANRDMPYWKALRHYILEMEE